MRCAYDHERRPERRDQRCQPGAAKFTILNAKFIVFDAKFIVFDAKFIVFDAEFLVFDAEFLDFDTQFIIFTHPAALSSATTPVNTISPSEISTMNKQCWGCACVFSMEES